MRLFLLGLLLYAVIFMLATSKYAFNPEDYVEKVFTGGIYAR